MSKTKNQSARQIQVSRRAHEEDALMWLGISAKCGDSIGAREMNLALAALAMEAADACVVPTTGEEFPGWTVLEG